MSPSPFDVIQVASPCSADWNKMAGTNRVRFCDQCKLNVYNLSGMPRSEAETLLAKSSGRLCVRLFRRPDGTVLTEDCPVGWQALKVRAQRVKTVVTYSLVLGLSWIGFGCKPKAAKPLMGEAIISQGEPLMGDRMVPQEKPKCSLDGK